MLLILILMSNSDSESLSLSVGAMDFPSYQSESVAVNYPPPSLEKMTTTSDISLVVGCRNRRSFLLQTLPTWLQHPQIKEILIVDWGESQQGETLEQLCQSPMDPRIHVLHTRGGGIDRWVLSVALNFGISQARFPILLKVDADTCLGPDFFNLHPLSELGDDFYAGDWRTARTINERHLNGVLLVHLKNFQRVNGYNEYIRTYGYDDSDLYTRLEESGLKYRRFNFDSLSHLSHDDCLRIGTEVTGTIKEEIVKNLRISQTYPWSIESKQTQWTPSGNVCPGHCCDKIWSPLNYILNASLPIERSLFIEPLNGLGNRLRAIASAAVLAIQHKRKLHIVWLMDLHCHAQFDELFQLRPDSFIVHKTRPPTFKPGKELKQQNWSNQILQYAIASETDSEVYISSACVISAPETHWTREAIWLRKELFPVPTLQHEIDQERQRLGGSLKDFVAVHLRVGLPAADHPWEDASTWAPRMQTAIQTARHNSRWQTFWEEMNRIALCRPTPELGPQQFLICGDSPLVYEEVLKASLTKPSHMTFHTILPRLFDRSLRQLQEAIIDAWLLSECQLVLGSPWSSYTELISRLRPIPTKIAGQHFPTPRSEPKQFWALLDYPTSLNIGDNIQSLAAQFVLKFIGAPTPTAFVERDNQCRTRTIESPLIQIQSTDTIHLIENGWFDGRFIQPQWAPQLRPLYLSYHLNEDPELLNDPLYSTTYRQDQKCSQRLLENLDARDHFLKYAPIGCRDQHTVNKFLDAGIPAFLSSCLTLTLRTTYLPVVPIRSRTNLIYVVDSHLNEPKLYNTLVPEEIRSQAVTLLHGMIHPPKTSEKQAQAEDLIHKYSQAKLIITSRLHCALPALALGTPVLFLYSSMQTDCRFDDTLRSILGSGTALPSHWNWSDSLTWEIPEPINNLIDCLSLKMLEHAQSWFAESSLSDLKITI